VYETFYKLTAKPFRLSPDPQFFYPSAGHKRALSYLLYGLNQAEGFVVITGSPGTGKTTLAHKLLSQIDPQSVVVAHLASTQIEAEDLLRLVAASFKLRSEHVSKAGLLKDIESFLLARARERKRCLLVVDEAQNLPPRSIEELRMLSNFQVGNKALMQVFLLGQEQFRVMLDSTHFEQLRQRVIADFHLHPLDAEETRRYIEARLQHVGWQNDPQFDAGAHALIFEYTGGLPRRINMFCDRLLLFGFLEGLHTLTHATVSSVIAELHNEILPRDSNVVFTPAERPVERITTPEARVTAAANSRTPASLDNSPLTSAEPRTARPESIATIAPKSATPSAPVLLRPAKPAERVATDTEVASSAPKRSAANLSRNIPDSAIADFLLTDARGLNSLDDPPQMLSNITPSLAGTESRWLLMVISACIVLAALMFWLYPSIQGALQRMQPTETQSHAPPANDSAEPSEALAQQITDPSEEILTEKRILAIPPPTSAESVSVGEVTGSPNQSNEPATTPAWWDHKAAATTTTGNNTAPRASESPVKVGAPQQKDTAKAKPGSNSVPRLVAMTPTAPAAKTATTATLPGATNTAATTTPKVDPRNQLDASTSAAAISTRELTLLVMKFARYYEEGNLPQFLSLFDEQVRTEDSNSIDAIRSDYTELFKKTAARQIVLGDIHWENAGRVAQGSGPFEVRIRATEGEPARSLKGDITFHIEKKENGVAIIALYHTPR